METEPSETLIVERRISMVELVAASAAVVILYHMKQMIEALYPITKYATKAWVDQGCLVLQISA